MFRRPTMKLLLHSRCFPRPKALFRPSSRRTLIAHAVKIAPEMACDQIMVVNLSGRGDKDVNTVAEILESKTRQARSVQNHEPNYREAKRGKTRKGFIPFVTAGDPDLETSLSIIIKLAEFGCRRNRARRSVQRSDGGWADDPAIIAAGFGQWSDVRRRSSTLQANLANTLGHAGRSVQLFESAAAVRHSTTFAMRPERDRRYPDHGRQSMRKQKQFRSNFGEARYRSDLAYRTDDDR